MQHLVVFTENDCKQLLKVRKGETKFGEHVQHINNLNNIYDDIVSLDVDYVIFGVSESIGVIGNHGNTGTHKAWAATIKVLLNIQSNPFINAKRILILGHLEYSEYQDKLKNETLTKKKRISEAKKIVEAIDTDVSYIVKSIVKAGKIPIIIGGGHNNAYGNIKGTSLALKKPINALNFDAHHDFRAEEGRHSGNGFSYAYNEGFLKNYFIFGIHENYISAQNLETLNTTKSIQFNTFEAIAIRNQLKFRGESLKALKHVNTSNFGLEIDCDAIENISSSAMTPSGFSVNKVRQFISLIARDKNVSYLHICEAAPNKKTSYTIGKLITCLITDFIKANGTKGN